LRPRVRRASEPRVEAPELTDEIDRALLPDAGHAGDVVARIPDQREHVDDVRWLHAELFDDAGLVEPGAVFAGIVNTHTGANELKEVLVDRHDRDVEAGRRRPVRDGAHHVARLINPS